MGLGKKKAKRLRTKNLIGTDNSVVITRGQGVWGEVEEDKGETNGDGRRKETGLGLVNTQFNTQLMYYRTVHLKPI